MTAWVAATKHREGAALAVVTVLLCLAAGGVAVLLGQREMWSGSSQPARVFPGYALPVPMSEGLFHWPSIAATWFLLHLQWHGRFAYASAVFALAAIGAVATRTLGGPGTFDVFVLADGCVGCAVALLTRSPPPARESPPAPR